MLDIIATGTFLAPLKDDENLCDLSSEIQQHCRERPRRIDRFTQLCLVGSGRCVQQHSNVGHTINADTGLYIGSRFAALANTISVHKQMMLHGQIPKPAHFINTLSNSAGYYVARNLDLTGKNLFISRAGLSTEAVFQVVELDLACNQVSQALIGVVDEGVLPLADHRQRLGMKPNAPLSEGSHWFLVKATPTTAVSKNKLATITHSMTFCHQSDAENWLKENVPDKQFAQLYSATNSREKLSQWPSVATQSTEFWKSLPADILASSTAAVLLKFIDMNAWPTLITINGDEDGRYHITCTEIPAKA